MRRRRVLPAVYLLISVALVSVACGGGGGSSPAAPSSSLVEIEYGSFQLVNEERVTNAVNPRLGRDADLDAIARAYSQQMRDEGFFSHTSPAGKSLGDRLQAAGYTFSAAGENLARVKGASNPAGYAHNLLMNNPSHRDNILNTRYGRMGVGVASRGSTVWITQLYVNP